MSDDQISVLELQAKHGDSKRKEVLDRLDDQLEIVVPEIWVIHEGPGHVAEVEEPGQFKSLCGEVNGHDPAEASELIASGYLRGGECEMCRGLLAKALIDELKLEVP